MTMHLEGPWLSTTGKKKGKQKFRNAEQARKAREQADSWNKLLATHGATQQPAKEKPKALKLNLSYRGQDTKIPSLGTGVGVATVKEQKVYTGTKMLGVATMHKSNSVPVFSSEEAENIARMRR